MAKNTRMGIFPATVEGAVNVANRLVDMEVYGLPDDYFDSYRERIAAITKDDVVRVANKYVDPDRATIVIVGKATEITSPLKELSLPVSVYDVEGKLVQ
jgi:zinc protease